MPWGAALALTLVGAVMVVVGLTVVGRIGAPTNEAGSLPGWVVPLVVIPTWGVIAVVALRRMRARRGVIADAAVPDVLTEPPSDLDPAVVGVVVGFLAGHDHLATAAGLQGFLRGNAGEQGVGVGLEGGEIDLVAFPDRGGEGFEAQVEFGGRDFLAALLFGHLGVIAADRGELGFGGFDRF